jgi:hypothetical protein
MFKIFLLLISLFVYKDIKEENFKNFLLYPLPFLISYTYKSHSKKFFIILTIIHIWFQSIDKILSLILLIILDFTIEFVPRKLQRLEFLFVISFIINTIQGICNFSSNDIIKILSGVQILSGSFQAVRILEKKLKKLRTDLGTIYYKSQVLIIILKVFSNHHENKTKFYFDIILELFILLSIILGVFLRPTLETRDFDYSKKLHGYCMRISFILIYVKHMLIG